MPRRVSFATLLAFASVLVFAVAGAAHDLFIKLDTYFVPEDSPVRVTILNSTFLLSENSITADRVADISAVVDGRRTRLSMDSWDAEGDSTFVEWRTGSAGTYVLGVSTLPRELGMSADDFNRYLASDGVVDVLQQRALDGELNEEAWEKYAKHVKAVVQVGDRPSDGIDMVLGYPAEIVPLDNPYRASVGDELRFRTLVDGEAVSRQLVIAGGQSSTGVIHEREARSDPNGIVSFEVDEPGRWYLKFINMAKTQDPDLDYESKWATITFEVR